MPKGLQYFYPIDIFSSLISIYLDVKASPCVHALKVYIVVSL